MTVYLGSTPASVYTGANLSNVYLGSLSTNVPSIVVTNSAELLAAVTAATTGRTILLAPSGTKYNLTATGLNPSSVVTITSQNPSNRAVFDGIRLITCSKIRILNVDMDSRAVSKATSLGNISLETGSTNCTIDGVVDIGRATVYYTGVETVGYPSIRVPHGSTGLTIQNCTISYCGFGVQLAGAHSNLTITNNNISFSQFDCIQVGISGNNITITNNKLNRPLGSEHEENHYDYIQLYNTISTVVPYTNVTITGNYIDGRGGSKGQGILIGNEAIRDGGAGTSMRHNNFVIEDNILDTDAQIGIALYDCITASIARNTVYQDINSLNTDDVTEGQPGVRRVPGILTAGVCQPTVVVTQNMLEMASDTGGGTWTDNYFLSRDPFLSSYILRIMPGVHTPGFDNSTVQVPSSWTYGPTWMRTVGVTFAAVPTVPGSVLADPGFDDATKWVGSTGLSVSGGKGIANRSASNFGALTNGTTIKRSGFHWISRTPYLYTSGASSWARGTTNNIAASNVVVDVDGLAFDIYGYLQGTQETSQRVRLAAGDYLAPIRFRGAVTNQNFSLDSCRVTLDVRDHALPNMVAEWAAAYSTGQNIPNLVAAPNDSSAQSAYDFTLGPDINVSSGDPLLVAASGVDPAAWEADGTADNIQGLSTAFFRNIGNNEPFTYYAAYRAPTTWGSTSMTLMGCGALNNTQAGFQWRLIPNTNTFRLVVSNGSGVSINPVDFVNTVTLPTTGYFLLVLNYNPTTEAYKVFFNSATATNTGTATALTPQVAISATKPIQFSAFPVGARLITSGIARGDQTANVGALRTQIQTEHGITLF